MLVYARIQPFALSQDLYLTDDEDNIVEQKSVPMNELKLEIQKYCQENNVEKIKISGNQDYLTKMAGDLMTKYNCKCPVEII